MRDFARLVTLLEGPCSPQEAVQALTGYFAAVGPTRPADASWAVHLWRAGRWPGALAAEELRRAACRAADIDDALFDESLRHVGDIAETAALVVPSRASREPGVPDIGLARWMAERLAPLGEAPPEARADALPGWWDALDDDGRRVLNRLLIGTFRSAVSPLMLARALAASARLPVSLVAQRLLDARPRRHGSTRPEARDFDALVSPPGSGSHEIGTASGQPYPFQACGRLAALPVAASLHASLGPRADWSAEWQHDGLRVQAVRRGGRLWLWTRDGLPVAPRFPEVAEALAALPDGTVLDAILQARQDGRAAPAHLLQARLSRRTVTRRQLADSPAELIAIDLLEAGHQDLRGLPLRQRLDRLGVLAQAVPLRKSTPLDAGDWPAVIACHAAARRQGARGVVLKRWGGPYGEVTGERAGAEEGGAPVLPWLAWATEPLSIPGVLLYVQPGAGSGPPRLGCTFAAWNRPPHDAAEAEAVAAAIERGAPPAAGGLQLAAFARFDVELDSSDGRALERQVRELTLHRFGPVRSLRPALLAQVAFDALVRSSRHKCGFLPEGPRLARLRPDLALHAAGTLTDLARLAERPGDAAQAATATHGGDGAPGRAVPDAAV